MTIPPSLRGRLSVLLGHLYFRAVEQEARELGRLGLGVRPQEALTVLADEGPLTPRELGQRLGTDRKTTTAVAESLERDNLVERRHIPTDRRAHHLALTRVGHLAQQQGARAVAALERELLAGLTEGERRGLTELLAKATDVLH